MQESEQQEQEIQHFSSVKLSVIQGDVLDILNNFQDNYFHGVLTDPPYGISFLLK